MSKGVLLFAHNNEQIDFGKMALLNALLVRHNWPNTSVSLVTDQGTLDWSEKNLPNFKAYFDKIIVQTYPSIAYSDRHFRDTRHTSKLAQYKNYDRTDAYEVTPYDETIVIDSDYLIFNDSLNAAWGSRHSFMINHAIESFSHIDKYKVDETLEPAGIDQAWATVMYFKKDADAKIIFDLCKHIKENYSFYKFLYGFSGGLFRNDFVFSIALHICQHYSQVKEDISLPNPKVLTSFDWDDVIELTPKSILLLIEKPKCENDYNILRLKDTNIHVMNKFGLLRCADKLIQELK